MAEITETMQDVAISLGGKVIKVRNAFLFEPKRGVAFVSFPVFLGKSEIAVLTKLMEMYEEANKDREESQLPHN